MAHVWWWVRRSRKGYEKNPRYKYDNIISLDLDMPEGTTQNYIGPDMVSNVAQVRGGGERECCGVLGRARGLCLGVEGAV